MDFLAESWRRAVHLLLTGDAEVLGVTLLTFVTYAFKANAVRVF